MSDFDIKVVRCHPEAKIPVKAYPSDAAVDLYSVECKRILPLHREIISTGIKIAIPEGYYGRVAPRSGLAVKNGISVMAGVIDAGFRNEIKVVLYNTNFQLEDLRDFLKPSAYSSIFGQRGSYLVNIGDKIAQLIIYKLPSPNYIEVNSLDETVRGEKGFGSSDKL